MRYDPSALGGLAQTLDRGSVAMTIALGLGGGVVGFGSGSVHSPAAAVTLFVLGALAGALVGMSVTIKFKLDAQRALCVLHAEQRLAKMVTLLGQQQPSAALGHGWAASAPAAAAPRPDAQAQARAHVQMHAEARALSQPHAVPQARPAAPSQSHAVPQVQPSAPSQPHAVPQARPAVPSQPNATARPPAQPQPGAQDLGMHTRVLPNMQPDPGAQPEPWMPTQIFPDPQAPPPKQ